MVWESSRKARPDSEGGRTMRMNLPASQTVLIYGDSIGATGKPRAWEGESTS